MGYLIWDTAKKFFDETISSTWSSESEGFYDTDTRLWEQMKRRHRTDDEIVFIDRPDDGKYELCLIELHLTMLRTTISGKYESDTDDWGKKKKYIFFQKITRSYERASREGEFPSHITEYREKLGYYVYHHYRNR